MVERGNRTLGDSLRCLLLEKQSEQNEWDSLLPHIMRCYRAIPNASTGETSNYMMLGRELRIPGQLIYSKEETEPFISTTNYCIRLQQTMATVHDMLRHSQLQLLSSGFNEDSEPLFIEGDLVLMDNRTRRKGVNPKLQPTFTGPYLVERSYPNRTYRLKDIKSPVNESRLKFFKVRSDIGDKFTTGNNVSWKGDNSVGKTNPSKSLASKTRSKLHKGQPDKKLSHPPQCGESAQLPLNPGLHNNPSCKPGQLTKLTPDHPVRRTTRVRKAPDRYGNVIAH